MEHVGLLEVLGQFTASLTDDRSPAAVIDQLATQLLGHFPVFAVNVVLDGDPERRHLAIGSRRSALAGQRPPDHEGATACFPLRGPDEEIGRLELYCDYADDLDPHHLTAARALADVTATYLYNADRRQEAQRQAERLRYDSLHDSLTGLANRALLQDRLEHAVAVSIRGHTTVGVLFLDIDGFKRFNDDFGHAAGDILLSLLAARVQSVLRSGDTMARFGGDEFVVVSPGLSDPAQATRIADRILAAVEAPFDIPEAPMPQQIVLSIGIAFAGHGLGSADLALEQADDAMYRAKRSGGGRRMTATGAPCLFETLPPTAPSSETGMDGQLLAAHNQ